MMVEINISIPHEKVDHHVIFPGEKFLKAVKKQEKNWEQVRMKVGNLAHGCDGAVISFGGDDYSDSYTPDEIEEGSVFGFVVSKEKLSEIIDALQFTLENFNG